MSSATRHSCETGQQPVGKGLIPPPKVKGGRNRSTPSPGLEGGRVRAESDHDIRGGENSGERHGPHGQTGGETRAKPPSLLRRVTRGENHLAACGWKRREPTAIGQRDGDVKPGPHAITPRRKRACISGRRIDQGAAAEETECV